MVIGSRDFGIVLVAGTCEAGSEPGFVSGVKATRLRVVVRVSPAVGDEGGRGRSLLRLGFVLGVETGWLNVAECVVDLGIADSWPGRTGYPPARRVCFKLFNDGVGVRVDAERLMLVVRAREALGRPDLERGILGVVGRLVSPVLFGLARD